MSDNGERSHPRVFDLTAEGAPELHDSVEESIDEFDPIVAQVVDRLVTVWNGEVQGSVHGRTQVSFDSFEIFVSRLTEPEVTARTLLERPLSLSALCGYALDPESEYRIAIEWFLDDEDTLPDVTVLLRSSRGIQVWLDRHVADDIGAFEGIDVLVHNFFMTAFALAMNLQPYELDD